MGQTLRMLPEARAEFASTTADLLQSISRTLILATGGVCVVCYTVAVTTPWWNRFVPSIWLICLIFGLT